MDKWQQIARFVWALVRDVVFAGFGLWLIYHELTDPGRQAVEVTLAYLGLAAALTVPSAAEHIKAILPASAGESAVESSSARSEQHGSPSSSTSSPSREVHGEPAGE